MLDAASITVGLSDKLGGIAVLRYRDQCLGYLTANPPLVKFLEVFQEQTNMHFQYFKQISHNILLHQPVGFCPRQADIPLLQQSGYIPPRDASLRVSLLL